MPIRDTAAMNSSLNNDYGTTAGPNAPAGWDLALFAGDPMVDPVDGGGVEADATTCPGYARVALAQADFGPAADGMKQLVSPAQFPNTTAEWDVTITHWALFATGTEVMWDCGPLTDELDVTAAGAGPSVEVTVFYDDTVAEA